MTHLFSAQKYVSVLRLVITKLKPPLIKAFLRPDPKSAGNILQRHKGYSQNTTFSAHCKIYKMGRSRPVDQMKVSVRCTDLSRNVSHLLASWYYDFAQCLPWIPSLSQDVAAFRALHHSIILNSVRRFSCRPSGVSFVASATCSP